MVHEAERLHLLDRLKGCDDKTAHLDIVGFPIP